MAGKAKFAALALLAALGCGVSPRPRPELSSGDRGAVFPLAPGSSWIYEVRDAAGRVSRLRARVNGEIELGSESKVTLVEESGGVPGERSFESNEDVVGYYKQGGLIFRSTWGTPQSRDGERLAPAAGEPVLPEDPEQQPVWRGSFPVLAVESEPFYEARSESRLASTGDSVAVPAGDFRRCLRVETTVTARVPSSPTEREITHYYTDWYAPGVGLVKTMSFVDVDGRRIGILQANLLAFESGPSP